MFDTSVELLCNHYSETTQVRGNTVCIGPTSVPDLPELSSELDILRGICPAK
jgi:hypothetical protein